MSYLNGLNKLAAPGQAKDYRPIARAPLYPGTPSYTKWDTRKAISEGFAANSWVYRCTMMTAEAASTIPLGEQVRDSDGKWVFDWKSGLSNLLGYWSELGPMRSISRSMIYLDIGGNVLLGKIGGGSKRLPQKLRVENPSAINPVATDEGGLDYYEVTDAAEGAIPEWQPEDVCHAMLEDPENPLWGMSRLKAAAKAVDLDNEALTWNLRRFDDKGVPVGFIADPSIDTTEKRRSAQKDVDAEWGKRRTPWVLGGLAEWRNAGLSARDMEWLEGRRFGMREIVIVWGYHPALFGEDATYNNSREAERSKWNGAVLPRAQILCDSLTRGLIPKGERQQRRVWYDTSGVEALNQNRAEQIKDASNLAEMGVPVDDAVRFVGLDLAELPNGLGKVPMVGAGREAVSSVVNRDIDPGAPL